MIHLIIATRNAHKVEEIAAIVGRHFTCWPMTRLGSVPELIEDGATFEENATAKAIQLASWLASRPEAIARVGSTGNLLVVADDSGLEVDQLNGAPGVRSARFAALDTASPGNSNDADNNAKLMRLLKDVPRSKRTARFRCVLAVVAIPSTAGRKSASREETPVRDRVRLFEGVCEGCLASVPRGVRGFGYDPLFVPSGYRRTFGELDDSVKSRISHRARAVARLKRALLKELGS
jgi:XTP/dITP diphosphohydrolase